MEEIKILESADKDIIEKKVNELLSQGYKISSTSCGFVQSEIYDFCSSYHAILVKEG